MEGVCEFGQEFAVCSAVTVCRLAIIRLEIEIESVKASRFRRVHSRSNECLRRSEELAQHGRRAAPNQWPAPEASRLQSAVERGIEVVGEIAAASVGARSGCDAASTTSCQICSSRGWPISYYA